MMRAMNQNQKIKFFPCDQCRVFPFWTQIALTQHKKRVHIWPLQPRTKKYQCKETRCMHPGFDSSSGLRHHMKTKHGDKEPSQFIDDEEEESEEEDLEPHKCDHPQCNNRGFGTLERYRQHMNAHDEIEGVQRAGPAPPPLPRDDDDDEPGPPIKTPAKSAPKPPPKKREQPEQPHLVHGVEPEAEDDDDIPADEPQEKIFKCAEAGCTSKPYKREYHYNKHVESHKPVVPKAPAAPKKVPEAKNFKCDVEKCKSRPFKTAEQLKNHQQRVHKEVAPEAPEESDVESDVEFIQPKMFPCTYEGCEQPPYQREHFLKKHLEKHRKEEEKAQKTHGMEKEADEETIHTEAPVRKAFICSHAVCRGKSFRSESDFSKHLKKVHKPIPEEEEDGDEDDGHSSTTIMFPCTYRGNCRLSFAKRSALMAHLRTCHRVQNPGVYLQKAAAKTNSEVKEEKMGEKFKCPIAGCRRHGSFDSEEGLQMHIHNMHPEEEDEDVVVERERAEGGAERVEIVKGPEFPCRQSNCPRTFPTKRGASSHFTAAHKVIRIKEEPIDEEYDDEVFEAPEEIPEDVQPHPPSTASQNYPAHFPETLHPYTGLPTDFSLTGNVWSHGHQASNPPNPSLSGTSSEVSDVVRGGVRIKKEIVEEEEEPEQDDTMESQDGMEEEHEMAITEEPEEEKMEMDKEPKMFTCQSAGCKKVFKREYYYINHCEKVHGIRMNSDGKKDAEEPEKEPIVEEPEDDDDDDEEMDDNEPGTSNLFHCPQRYCSKRFNREDRYNLHLVTAHPAILEPIIDCQHLIVKEISEDVDEPEDVTQNAVSIPCPVDGCKRKKPFKSPVWLQRHIDSCHSEKGAESVVQKKEGAEPKEAWQPRKCTVAKCKSSVVFKTEIRYRKHVTEKHGNPEGPAPDENDDEEEEEEAPEVPEAPEALEDVYAEDVTPEDVIPEVVEPKPIHRGRSSSLRTHWVTTAHGEFADTSDRFFVPKIPEFRQSDVVVPRGILKSSEWDSEVPRADNEVIVAADSGRHVSFADNIFDDNSDDEPMEIDEDDAMDRDLDLFSSGPLEIFEEVNEQPTSSSNAVNRKRKATEDQMNMPKLFKQDFVDEEEEDGSGNQKMEYYEEEVVSDEEEDDESLGIVTVGEMAKNLKSILEEKVVLSMKQTRGDYCLPCLEFKSPDGQCDNPHSENDGRLQEIFEEYYATEDIVEPLTKDTIWSILDHIQKNFL